MGQSAPPFFCAFDALAINDRNCRTGFFPSHLPDFNKQRMMKASQSAVPFPQPQILVNRTPGGQILGQRPPLASRHQNVEHAIQNLTDAHRPPPTSPLRRGYQRFRYRPLNIRQITWVPLPRPFIDLSILCRPHIAPICCRGDDRIISDSSDSRTFRTGSEFPHTKFRVYDLAR